MADHRTGPRLSRLRLRSNKTLLAGLTLTLLATPMPSATAAPGAAVLISPEGASHRPGEMRVLQGSSGRVLHWSNSPGKNVELLDLATGSGRTVVPPTQEWVEVLVSGDLVTVVRGDSRTTVTFEDPAGAQVGSEQVLVDTQSVRYRVIGASPRGALLNKEEVDAAGTVTNSLVERRPDGSDVELLRGWKGDSYGTVVGEGADVFYSERSTVGDWPYPSSVFRVSADNPGHPVQVSRSGDDVKEFAVAGGVAAYVAGTTLVRVNVSTGASSVRTVSFEGWSGRSSLAVTPDGTAWFTSECDTTTGSCEDRLLSAPADPARPAVVLAGAGGCSSYCDVVSDGTRLFAVTRPGDETGGLTSFVPGDAEGTVVAAHARARRFPVNLALAPGRVLYADDRSANRPLHARALTGADSGTLGEERLLQPASGESPCCGVSLKLTASGDRYAFIDQTGRLQLVDRDGQATDLGAAVYAKLSGWHLLFVDGADVPRLHDVRTGATTQLAAGSYDLWGPYLAMVSPDGSLSRIHIGSGETTELAGPSSEGGYAGIWGDLVMRQSFTSALVVDARTGARSDLPGFLNGDGCDEGTIYQMGDGAAVSTHCGFVRVEKLDGSGSIDVPATGHAAIDAGRVVYGKPDGSVHVQDLGLVTHPRLLDAVAPTYARVLDAGNPWSAAVVFSHATSSCTLTLSSGSTTLRTLPCTSASGEATVLWDGSDSAGAAVPDGSYSWVVRGASDSGVTLKDPDGTSDVAASGTLVLDRAGTATEPTITSATPLQGGAELRWSLGTDAGTPTGFEIEVGPDAPAASAPGDVRSADLTGLLNGIEHSVRLRAVYADGPGVWSAPMSVTPNGCPGTRFSDVGVGGFCPDIAWMVERAISTGSVLEDGTRLYKPVSPVSRQAMAPFLYRAAGSPSFPVPAQPSFADVPTTHPFFTEIEWMSFAGISIGYDNPDGGKRLYKPVDPVSRQAMAPFLYRALGSPQFTPPSTSTFADVPTTHMFFKEIEFMAARSISTGTAQENDKPLYKPLDAVSRQAMAAFLHRSYAS